MGKAGYPTFNGWVSFVALCVIPMSIVAGITSISIDHTEYLGTTEEQIAREKAAEPSVRGATNAALIERFSTR